MIDSVTTSLTRLSTQMTESTLERLFPSRDWKAESVCDTCCQWDSVVRIDDENACYDCLLTHYDEDGEKVDLTKVMERDYAELAEDAARRIALQNFAYNLVFLAFGVMIGAMVTAAAA